VKSVKKVTKINIESWRNAAQRHRINAGAGWQSAAPAYGVISEINQKREMAKGCQAGALGCRLPAAKKIEGGESLGGIRHAAAARRKASKNGWLNSVMAAAHQASAQNGGEKAK